MDAAALLDGLNDAQRRAVTSDAAPLVILAGAGSGKTRVLTRRIAYRCLTEAADPRHVIALTFTRKAAGELSTRLRALGLRDKIAAGTFHAVAYAQLRRSWADRHVTPPTLLERKGQLLARLLGRGSGVKAIDVAGEIEWAKARMVRPSDYAREAVAARRRPPVDADAMAQLFERYETEKRNRRMVDFDDLLALCIRAIETDADFAAAQRWMFGHLFVDEFQDVNPLQFRLLEAWRGERSDLCVVGDPNQAIYAWNGADPSLITKLPTRLPGTETITLERNYRSTPQIVATANRVLECAAVTTLRLRATRPEGPIPTVVSHDTDVDEARAIARAITRHHTATAPWSHHAVLTRTNAQAVLLAESLRGAGAPVRVRGQMPFLQLPEVREALRSLQRGRGGLRDALGELETRVGPDPETGAAPDGLGGEGAHDDTPELDLGPAASTLSDAELARLRNLEELLRLANEYLADDRDPSAAGFEAWLNATVGSDDVSSAGNDAVDVATFHAAKGLEWPIVHLAGIESGLVPIGHAQSTEQLAEERRLFYVAVTRAQHELHVHWSEHRTFGSRTARRRPSPYLEEIEPVLDALRRGAEPADAAQHLPLVRDVVRTARAAKSTGRSTALAPGDQALFEELRRWRSQRAKAAAVPAYVIFDDKTLTEVAARRPVSRAALLQVPGIGPVKLERYGDDLLAVVAHH